MLKNGLKLIISFIILLTVAASDGVLHLHQTPNRKFFCFPVNCGPLLSCGGLIRRFFYLPLSLIDRSVFVVCLFVIGPINFVFKQLLRTESVASCRGRLPWRRDDLPLLQLSKSSFDLKPINCRQTVCRRSTFTS